MTKSFENRIFLSQTEVAERLGASPGTVKKLRDTGILPYTRFPASTRVFILVKDVEEMETQFLNPGKGVIKTPNRLEITIENSAMVFGQKYYMMWLLSS